MSVVDDVTASVPQNIFHIGELNNKLTPSQTQSKTKYRLSSCVSPLHKDFDQTWALVEWVELNRLLGVDHFVFYITSVGPNCLEILKYYRGQGIATLVHWNILDYVRANDVDYFAQQSAINDCTYRMKTVTDLLMVTDLDEFVIPQKKDDMTIDDMLVRLPDAAQYIFRHIAFAVEKQPDEYTAHLITQENTILAGCIKAAGDRSKLIFKPTAVTSMGVHDTWSSHEDKHVVDPEIGLLHHYRNTPPDGEDSLPVSDQHRNQRAMKYSADLKHNMRTVVSDLKSVFKESVRKHWKGDSLKYSSHLHEVLGFKNDSVAV